MTKEELISIYMWTFNVSREIATLCVEEDFPNKK